MAGFQTHRSFLRLTAVPADLPGFDAVIDRVAQKVAERSFEPLQNLAVHRRGLSPHLKPNGFSERLRHVAHHPPESLNAVGKWTHAAVENFVIEAVGEIYESPLEELEVRKARRQSALTFGGLIPQIRQSPGSSFVRRCGWQQIGQTIHCLAQLILEALQSAQVRREGTCGFLDPVGWQFHIRMNSLNPPFNNPKARQAVQMLVESRQEAYLSATGQTGDLGKVCLAPFVCGSPNETMVGTEKFQKYDPDKIKALFKEGGYTGEPVVLMDPTDQQNLHFLALVLNEHLKEVGINVDLQAMDWSTLVGRRSVKAPPSQDRGGWNIFPTAWPSSAMMDPIINAPLDSSCDGKNWFGWPCDEAMQKLRLDYLGARNADERKKLVELIQLRFLEEAPYAYAGQYFPPIAYRKDRLKGVIGMVSPVYWNMEKISA